MKACDQTDRAVVTELPHSLLREFFLGFVKIHILHHASEGPVYGLQLIEELARHGYDLSPGTLYPLLHSLKNSGYIAGEKKVVGGKIRKYYEITPLGEQALVEVKSKISELVAEVLPGLGESDDASRSSSETVCGN